MKFYAGIDIHKESFFGTVLDESGTVIEQGNFPNTKEALQRLLFMPKKDTEYDAVLADPRKVKQISGKKKTDEVDSRILADMLRTGYLPVVYIPDEDIIEHLEKIADSHQGTVAQAALNYLLSKPAIVSVIIGVKTKDQLRENLKTVDWQMTHQEVQQLDSLSSPPRVYPNWFLAMSQKDRTKVILNESCSHSTKRPAE